MSTGVNLDINNMDRGETKPQGVLQFSTSSASLNSIKNENASEDSVDDNLGKDESQSEKSDESTENLSFLNESDLIDDILMPENIVSDDEMSNPENCVYAYRGSVSESPDLLLRNQPNNQQDDETDFLEMDFDPEQNSDADGGCYIDFQHLLTDNKPACKSLENGKNSAKMDDVNLNCSVPVSNISAINITVAPSTSQYASEIMDASKPSTNKNTGTIPKKPAKSSNCSFTPTLSSHCYQTKSKLKDAYLINSNSNSINNNHLNSICVNKKLSNSSHNNNSTINTNLNNNTITNLNNTINNNNNNSKIITNNNITSCDPTLSVNPNQISVTTIKSPRAQHEKSFSSGVFKNSDSDLNNILTTKISCKPNVVYSNGVGDVLFDKLLYTDDKKNSVNIFNHNCDEKTIIEALESIGLEPNKIVIKQYFIEIFEMDTSQMDLMEYLLYLSKRNCDYHKLRDMIILSCSCDKLSIAFYPLHQNDEQQPPNLVTVPIKEILKRWSTSTNLKQIIQIKNKNYHTMNVLGKIINILRQPRQRLVLENFIEIPQFYKNGYLNVSKLSVSSSS